MQYHQTKDGDVQRVSRVLDLFTHDIAPCTQLCLEYIEIPNRPVMGYMTCVSNRPFNCSCTLSSLQRGTSTPEES